MTAPPIRAFIGQRAKLPVEPEREPEREPTLAPVAWRDLFGNEHPVEVEIGCGQGRFLLGAARNEPGSNFLGLERRDSLVAKAQRAIDAGGMSNVRVLCCDARCVIRHLVPDRSVHAYHLYFPDPWWKSRHHKRRIHEGSLPAALRRTLAISGKLYVATDVEPLFRALTDRLTSVGFRQTSYTAPEIETSFSHRCRSESRPIFRSAFTPAHDLSA